jgi:hypothetical protein
MLSSGRFDIAVFHACVCTCQMSTAEILQTRQSLVNYLSISLGGDVLAAEYLLLHLLSQVTRLILYICALLGYEFQM